MLGELLEIKEVTNLKLTHPSKAKGKNGGQLGIKGMIDTLCGYGKYDGYSIKTNCHEYLILINNGQCCCENWGCFSSEDDFQKYVGKKLIKVELTDTELNKKKYEEDLPYGLDAGGIQFVDFVFADGSVLQFAVYNEHNGYYGHDIIIARDNKIFCTDTL